MVLGTAGKDSIRANLILLSRLMINEFHHLSSLLKASASFLHRESFCRRDVKGIFERLGRHLVRIGPLLRLTELDNRVLHLQSHATEKFNASGYSKYSTVARDYISFCQHQKYLTGARHFLHEYYPTSVDNQASPLV